jgi:cardiolipin synthase C
LVEYFNVLNFRSVHAVFFFLSCFRVLPAPAANIRPPVYLPPDSSSVSRLLLNHEGIPEGQTGVLSLENGGNSLVTRLWFFRNAKKSIDIQYFSFARNITGMIATQYLVQAADRGVKVRLLIDELSGRMNAREIKILDKHENIEVRVYNAGVKLGRADKKIKYLKKNRNRLTRRMHNKTLTIDGQLAIIGGRNMSDEYFDFDDKYNFRDRDVLMIGKAAKDVQHSFNEYWQNPLTVTCSELVGESGKEFSVDALFAKLNELKTDTARVSQLIRSKLDHFPGGFAENLRSGTFQFVKKVSFVSDKPGKNEDRDGRKGGLCDDTIIALLKNASISVDIQTPYFITTGKVRQLLKETVDRGVRVRVLTNSLAAIDNNVAFSPYKRDRKKNLQTGTWLYEFRPDASVRFDIMSPDVQAELHYEPVIGLHSKSMVIDGQIAVIGSYNVEPRSANLNTECIAVFRSGEIAHHLANRMEEEFLPENSWLITESYNPDKKASLKKKITVFIGHMVPKKML